MLGIGSFLFVYFILFYFDIFKTENCYKPSAQLPSWRTRVLVCLTPLPQTNPAWLNLPGAQGSHRHNKTPGPYVTLKS